MIVRPWMGWTTPGQAAAYEALLRTAVFPSIAQRRVDGYLGVELMRRPAGHEVEFATMMRFRDMAAVRAFAGEDFELAYVPREARALLARFDERSRHYEVREAHSGT